MSAEWTEASISNYEVVKQSFVGISLNVEGRPQESSQQKIVQGTIKNVKLIIKLI